MSATDKHGIPLRRPDGSIIPDAERMAMRRERLTRAEVQAIAQAEALNVLRATLTLPNGLLSLLEGRYALTPQDGWEPVPPWTDPREVAQAPDALASDTKEGGEG